MYWVTSKSNSKSIFLKKKKKQSLVSKKQKLGFVPTLELIFVKDWRMDWQLAICIKVHDIVYATVYKIEKGIF